MVYSIYGLADSDLDNKLSVIIILIHYYTLYDGCVGTVSSCTVWSTRTLAVRSRYCTLVRSRYARGAVEVRLWCGRGAVEVRSWCGRAVVVRLVYTVEARSWFASGSVRFVNFSTGDTVRSCDNDFTVYLMDRNFRGHHKI